MKELVQQKDRRMTLRQVAQVTGAAYSTVAAYAQRAGWTQNGKATLLDEKQTAIILEAMKIPKASGRKSRLLFEMEGIDATKSRALRIDLLHRQIEAEMGAEINELHGELDETRQLLETRTADLSATRELADRRAAGLEMIQHIAEAGGLLMSDRDDIEAMYRRRP
jgi:hypothetical protein